MPAASGDTFLAAFRNVYAMAAPPSGVSAMPTLYLDEAPERTGYPRAVIVHGGEVPDADSFSESDGGVALRNVATVTLLFMAENDSDIAESLATSVRSVYTPDAINLSLDSHARIFRTFYRVYLDTMRSTADKPIYVAEIRYKGVFGTGD